MSTIVPPLAGKAKSLSPLFTDPGHEVILDHILSSLPAKDLVACSAVCRNINHVITTSSKLQLVLRRSYHGVPPLSSLSNTHDQLSRLIILQSNLLDLRPANVNSLPLPSAQSIQTSGDLLLIGESIRDTLKSAYVLNVPPQQVPPSWPRVIDGWSLWDLKKEFDDRPTLLARVEIEEPILAMVLSEQDNLLVIATRQADEYSLPHHSKYRFHLHTLRPTAKLSSSRKRLCSSPPAPHAQAASPYLDLVIPESETMDIRLRLAGHNRLLVSFSRDPTEQMVFLGVWDWKAGRSLGRVPYLENLPRRNSYALISDEYIICAVQEPEILRVQPFALVHDYHSRQALSRLRCGLVVYQINDSVIPLLPRDGECQWLSTTLPIFERTVTFDLPLFDLSTSPDHRDHISTSFHHLCTATLQASPATHNHPGGILHFELSGATLQSVYVWQSRVFRRPSRSIGSRGVVYLPPLLRLAQAIERGVIPFNVWNSYATFEPIDYLLPHVAVHGTRRLTIGGNRSLEELIVALSIQPTTMALKLVDFNPTANRAYVRRMDTRPYSPLATISRSVTVRFEIEEVCESEDKENEHGPVTVPRVDDVQREIVRRGYKKKPFLRDRIRALEGLSSLETTGTLHIASANEVREVVYDGQRIVVRSYGRIDILEF